MKQAPEFVEIVLARRAGEQEAHAGWKLVPEGHVEERLGVLEAVGLRPNVRSACGELTRVFTFSRTQGSHMERVKNMEQQPPDQPTTNEPHPQ